MPTSFFQHIQIENFKQPILFITQNSTFKKIIHNFTIFLYKSEHFFTILHFIKLHF